MGHSGGPAGPLGGLAGSVGAWHPVRDPERTGLSAGQRSAARAVPGIGSSMIEQEVGVTTRTVVCPECGTEVPAGRLSCIACGTLLASVAGGARRGLGAGSGPDLGLGQDGDDGASPADATGDDDSARAAAGTALEAARPMPPVLRDWTGPTPDSMGDPAAPAPASQIGSIPRPRWARDPRETQSGQGRPIAPDDLPIDAHADHVRPGDPIAGAYMPRSGAQGLGTAEPTPGGAPGSGPRPMPARVDADPPPPATAGAYVAPAIVPTAATTINGRPATASAIAAASIADGSVTSIPATPRPNRWFSTPDPATADPASTPGKAGLFSDLPFRSPGDVSGWAVAAGGILGTVAFLLPWSENGVMGSQPNANFTGQWGLANPADVIPMAVALVVLLLAILPNRIPVALRGVIGPIAVGGWFLGIWWSYATGPFGLGWGVDAAGLGGLVLVLGGALAQWRATDREDRDPA